MIPSDIISKLNELSCEDVAEKLGMEVKKHRALCFIHDDHHPSLSFWGKNRQHWICFVCNISGGPIDLVMKHEGYDFMQACEWLGNEFGIDVGFHSKTYAKAERPKMRIRRSFQKEERRPFDAEVGRWIIENCEITPSAADFLFGQRKLKKEIVEALNVKAIDDSRELVKAMTDRFGETRVIDSGFVTVTNQRKYFRMFTPCLIFPYYDMEENLVGMQSRYLGSKENAPRFQFVSSQKSRLFNLPMVNSLHESDDLFICEGVTDCLAMLSSGKNAVALPSATIIPKNDLFILKHFSLHMYPDHDKAGGDAYSKLFRFYTNLYTTIKKEYFPEGIKDYAEYYVKECGQQEVTK